MHATLASRDVVSIFFYAFLVFLVCFPQYIYGLQCVVVSALLRLITSTLLMNPGKRCRGFFMVVNSGLVFDT